MSWLPCNCARLPEGQLAKHSHESIRLPTSQATQGDLTHGVPRRPKIVEPRTLRHRRSLGLIRAGRNMTTDLPRERAAPSPSHRQNCQSHHPATSRAGPIVSHHHEWKHACRSFSFHSFVGYSFVGCARQQSAVGACATSASPIRGSPFSDEFQPGNRRLRLGFWDHLGPLCCVAQARRGAQPREESRSGRSRTPGTGLTTSGHRSCEMSRLRRLCERLSGGRYYRND